MGLPKRKPAFQPSILRCELLVAGGVLYGLLNWSFCWRKIHPAATILCAYITQLLHTVSICKVTSGDILAPGKGILFWCFWWPWGLVRAMEHSGCSTSEVFNRLTHQWPFGFHQKFRHNACDMLDSSPMKGFCASILSADKTSEHHVILSSCISKWKAIMSWYLEAWINKVGLEPIVS